MLFTYLVHMSNSVPIGSYLPVAGLGILFKGGYYKT